ncbi:hypothetical protein ACFVYJ_06375 [Pontibacter sp. JAM-7]|uniref:hypothetical protein n=1 Tax=Pontibacter sp. JAM-7 TaxID=3366581 RepID=UPI003AF8326A
MQPCTHIRQLSLQLSLLLLLYCVCLSPVTVEPASQWLNAEYPASAGLVTSTDSEDDLDNLLQKLQRFDATPPRQQTGLNYRSPQLRLRPQPANPRAPPLG